MSSDKLFFYIIKRNDNFELTALSENKLAWYNLPDDYKDLAEHKVLCSKRVIKNTIMTIKPINGYRKIGITIDDELRKEYYDEDGNLCFLNMPLEEANISNEHVVEDKSDEKNFLIEKIKELEAKLNLDNKFKLHDVEKRFILDKFNKSQNVNDWLGKFENECIRHKIFDATNMIEALRFFLSGSAENWYDANIIKIGLTNWSEWRASFLTVFADKGWKKIRTAYNFKYLGGSLIDYALAKESLCLEAELNATTISRINMIVIGLPLEIQNQLDREEITTIEKLYRKLRRLEESIHIKQRFRNNSSDKENTIKTNAYIQKNNADTKIKSENQKARYGIHSLNNETINKSNFATSEKNIYPKIKSNFNTSEKNIDPRIKKPCFICEELGWKNRYHPTNECRNRSLYSSKKEINLHNNNYSQNEEAEMMNIEIDKNSLN
ncbi:hypothetical protein HELRODRAFT_175101 [Helobdella robusta]|uniref:Uncharacterized protein n=1 Tax=Helobdella robusta TaxID=6412 RepID=T1F8U8_HELRO|nr:hypothetical protein HELRODRAFT_175101 [Helobdella robusta]ESO01074.1 hypothetical protein HELRODRAFT_175101 [Helobdella robusta]